MPLYLFTKAQVSTSNPNTYSWSLFPLILVKTENYRSSWPWSIVLVWGKHPKFIVSCQGKWGCRYTKWFLEQRSNGQKKEKREKGLSSAGTEGHWSGPSGFVVKCTGVFIDDKLEAAVSDLHRAWEIGWTGCDVCIAPEEAGHPTVIFYYAGLYVGGSHIVCFLLYTWLTKGQMVPPERWSQHDFLGSVGTWENFSV